MRPPRKHAVRLDRQLVATGWRACWLAATSGHRPATRGTNLRWRTFRFLILVHFSVPVDTPRWNGKLERFWHSLDTEWAQGRVWPDSTSRDRALASFIRFYNRRRPHSAAGGRAPITRVQQVRSQDS